ncbi:MAG TPA: hypothetical protein VE988_07150 [Gemmataceae bacterium]|nr:hypothetical protein [Gemmataceae bacterium]
MNRLAGLIILILLGGLLTFVGLIGLLGMMPPPPEEKEPSAQSKTLPMPAAETAKLIAVGQVLTGLLPIIPRTSSLGVLMASGFFGGTICFHLVRGEPYFVQSGLLLLTWIGGYLRNPGLLASLRR